MSEIHAIDELPVFVTSTGRPRHRHRWLGYVIATLTTVWIASIFVGAAGFSGLPELSTATAGPHNTPVAPYRARYGRGPHPSGLGSAWRAELRRPRAHSHRA
jgi:hypothetical protein